MSAQTPAPSVASKMPARAAALIVDAFLDYNERFSDITRRAQALVRAAQLEAGADRCRLAHGSLRRLRHRDARRASSSCSTTASASGRCGPRFATNTKRCIAPLLDRELTKTFFNSRVAALLPYQRRRRRASSSSRSTPIRWRTSSSRSRATSTSSTTIARRRLHRAAGGLSVRERLCRRRRERCRDRRRADRTLRHPGRARRVPPRDAAHASSFASAAPISSAARSPAARPRAPRGCRSSSRSSTTRTACAPTRC